MSQKLPTAPRYRKSAKRLFLREKSLRAKNPSIVSVGAAIAANPRKMSEYARQLQEKQKVRHQYGITESQFRGYYHQATVSRENTAERMLQLLETRLDNLVYRAGFAISRPQARQLVSHGFFQVNGRKVNVPSFGLSANDIVIPRKKTDLFKEVTFEQLPGWLSADKKNQQVTVTNLPKREDIDPEIKEQLIVEYYSR